MLNSCGDKNEGTHGVVERGGEKGPVCDPGYDLLFTTGREREEGN